MEITIWHRVAELLLEKKLTLPEIGKLMIINEAIRVVEPTEGAERIGFNVIDNRKLHDALVFGLLNRQPKETPISYTDLATMLDFTPRMIGSSVNRLISRGIVSKEDRGRLGGVYEVYPDRFDKLPTWINELTRALAELHNDAELKAQVAAETQQTQFYRGFEHLKLEIRERFYRPRKETDSSELAPLDLA